MKLTNLSFVDDLLMFCKGTESSVRSMTQVLEEFAKTSGLRVNHSKSNLYMGGLSDDKQKRLLELTGFQRGQYPMQYLGFPISTSKWSKQDCRALVDKVTARLQSWSTRNLSYAGRLQLLNSVLHTFHLYWAYAFLIPKGVLYEVEAKCRQFLWGGTQNKRRPALVSWAEVCTENRYGGLGVKNIAIWNIAAMEKLIWDIASNKDNLWVRWISGIYLKEENFWLHDCPVSSSWSWKALCSVRDKLAAGFTSSGWSAEDSGQYSTASGYKWLMGEQRRLDTPRVIWHRMTLP